ncbi:MAG TPA: hypothetical protein VJQ26_15040 [Ktedonobacteraceae bacterium]|nr:hypothetical protein [Ktedonobacteraceae bacterium]
MSEIEYRGASQRERRQAVRPFEGPQGMVAPAEVLLGVAMKERL